MSISVDEIAILRNHLTSRPRDLFLFDMATQTGLPAEQWLKLKVSDLSPLQIGDKLPVNEKNLKNGSLYLMTRILKESFDRYVREMKLTEEDLLLPSRKGGGVLTLSSVTRLVKEWFKECDIQVPKGLLALRRIWQDHYRHEIDDIGNDGPLPNRPTFSPIKIPTRQEAVFKELEKAILSGQIPPGERIVVEEIAKKLNVSKIPVREALGRLEAKGFVYLKPNWGYTVIELSRENLEEIFELRVNLECLAASKGVLNFTKKDIENLKHYQQQYVHARKNADSEMLLKMNRKFHFTLLRKANMPFLQTLIDQLWHRLTPYQNILFRQSLKPNPFVGVQSHEKIIHAAESGDIEGLQEGLKEDLTNSTRFIISLFDQYYA